LLDGAAVARRLRARAAQRAQRVAEATGRAPFLRVLLAGTDPASETYVAAKTRAAREAGIGAETIRLAESASPEALLAEVARANREEHVDGLLVQLPLPRAHDVRRVLDAIDPEKDVDGFHPENVGRLHQGRPRFVACTPAGILELLDAYALPLSGARAVVLGRSDIVGKPMAALLTARDATVTLCHSKTRDLAAVCREAEILVAAIGRPGFVTAEHVRGGAAVVDVGITRLTSLANLPGSLRGSKRLAEEIASRGRALCGDVDFDGVSRVAGHVTPVPGGVGPLTVAMLLENTVTAAELRRLP
jgi:methylenetetrahydrofolate dehydrogenase (NADP+)/methenyltetrahydrofolate cyclohydrolase